MRIFVARKEVLFLFTLIFSISCHSEVSESLPNSWQVKNSSLLSPLKAKGKNSSSENMVLKLKEIYSSKPYEKSYNELIFKKMYISNDLGGDVYVFDIKYVDDLQVVFVVDEEMKIVDNFLLSPYSF